MASSFCLFFFAPLVESSALRLFPVVVLAGCPGTHGCVFFFGFTVGVLAFGSAGGCVACVFCFFFLALFLLFSLGALLDVGFSLVPKYRAFAMVTADNVGVVLHGMNRNESSGNIRRYATDNSPLVSFLVVSPQPCLEQHLHDASDNA